MTIANKKELTTDKEYTGYIKVTRIYCLGCESPNDAQADNRFKNNCFRMKYLKMTTKKKL